MIDLSNGSSLDGYGKINVVLGKNGSGKSTLLRNIDTKLSRGDGYIRYITPERGGELKYDGNMETNRSNNPDFFSNSRRKNRWEQFRQSSVAEFRNLETLVLRTIEGDDEVRNSDYRFEQEIDKINTVLERINLLRSDSAGFDVANKGTGDAVPVADLSSGESELISLAVEILNFAYLSNLERYKDKQNWLLLDEPDVHLHPDLQYKLMQFLVNAMEKGNGKVLIATHSTSILSALCKLSNDVNVGFKQFDQGALKFQKADDAMKELLPMFGAHPLSNVFNEKPPLIVEGEDDERIWQTAVRQSEGRIKVFPCVASDIQSMYQYEIAAKELIVSVYDDAKAYSLRDRDDEPYEILDISPVVRMRLNCRNAENLIVSDDVLAELGTDWDRLREALEKWINDNPEHSRFNDAVAFRDSGWDRRNFQLKNLRMLLVGLTGSNKPWEVAVGRAITRICDGQYEGENSLKDFLGLKLVAELGLINK